MTDLCYVVQTVPSRHRFVKYLKHHIAELVTVTQIKNDPPMNTFLNTCRVAGANPRIHFEDDCILTKDFLRKAHDEINKNPNEVIQFFSRRNRDLEGQSYWNTGADFSANVCVYFPAGMSQRLIEFYDDPNSAWTDWDRKDGPTNFDGIVARYLQTNGMRYFNVIPNLVEHAQTTSSVNPQRPRFRQSKTFVDPETFMFPNPLPRKTKQRTNELHGS